MELFVLEGPDQGRSFLLGPQSVLGRDPTATVHLIDEEVSRRHAIITVGEGETTIEDLGSSNGTFVDDERISSETDLRAGQLLRIGKTLLEIRRPEGAGDPENLPSTKVPLPELGDEPPA